MKSIVTLTRKLIQVFFACLFDVWFWGAEWWRTADVHSRTGATFFPPLLGIPPLFAPPAQNHDSSSFHSRTSGKSNRNGPEKGIPC